MSRPTIALLTDFGTRDHYVGTMKGVMLGICPEATLVDISHEVPPQDVLFGSLALRAAYRFFPAGTVFLAVVDPGVGAGRRAIAVEAGEYRFVAPDNGVLTSVLHEMHATRGVELTERKYARPTVSRTFEGRDRFAPAAAWLAKGVALNAFGRGISDFHTIDVPRPVAEGDSVRGTVLLVDHFGNLITNIDRAAFERFARARQVAIVVDGHEIGRVVGTYAEAPAGEVCALFGSTDHLELALPGGSAAARLALGRGAAVVVTRR